MVNQETESPTYIDTKLVEDRASVDSCADALEKLASAMYAAYDWDDYAYQASVGAWEGETGQAYNDFGYRFRDLAFEFQRFCRKSAEGVRSYANQLRWSEQEMSRIRGEARRAGLTVVDWYIIHPDFQIAQPGLPPTVERTPCVGSAQDQNSDLARQKQLSDHYASCSADANKARSKIAKAVVDYIDPWCSDAESSNYLDRFCELMINAAEQVSTDYTMDTLIQYADYKIDGPVASKRAKALEAVRDKVRERSGNPAVRAGAQEASEEAVEKAASKSKIGQEAEAASGVAKVAKRGVRLLGKGIGALWSFGEAYTSDTPVKTAAEGLIASAVAASFAAPLVVSVSGIAAAAAPVVAGSLVAWGVSATYEELVPLDVQQRIEEGAKDMLSTHWSDGWKKWTGG